MLLDLAIPGSQVHAASFDCGGAATPRERAVCADPDLSRADDALDRSYRVVLGRLSTQAAVLIRHGQRDWLRSLDERCRSSPEEDGVRRCLADAYRDRQRDLADAVQVTGPFTIVSVDDVLVRRVDDDLLVSTVEYPQIDHPTTAALLAWNRAHVLRPATTGDCDGPGGQLDQRIRVNFATPMLINQSRTSWFSCPGTPHGYGSAIASTVVLAPTPHELRAADLFRPGSGWDVRLGDLVVAGVRAALDRQNIRDSAPSWDQVRETAARPSSWTLRRDALVVFFNPYDLGMGRTFAPEIAVPWPDLATCLRPGVGLPP